MRTRVLRSMNRFVVTLIRCASIDVDTTIGAARLSHHCVAALRGRNRNAREDEAGRPASETLKGLKTKGFGATRTGRGRGNGGRSDGHGTSVRRTFVVPSSRSNPTLVRHLRRYRTACSPRYLEVTRCSEARLNGLSFQRRNPFAIDHRASSPPPQKNFAAGHFLAPSPPLEPLNPVPDRQDTASH
jgi:hypothetical protein